ncbi:hypothetical protein C8R46DRAFT_1342990 [Mycena filopes]|nr:hypothetical protein C8R46DRAFT_1342990 [Mycena filopes]
MSHYIHPLPYFPDERTYYSTSTRSAQCAPQPSCRPSHYIPTPASLVSPWNPVHFSCQPGEHNSRSAPTTYAHRTVTSPPSLLDALSVYTPPFTRPGSCATVSDPDAYSTPYASADYNTTESSASPPPPEVKQEQPDDDGFIMDYLPAAPVSQMLAPPTEVPLRATQASPAMRRMMGVFRLNPFAMHAHGGRGVLAPWAGGEARPLDEEPRIFEFQLELTAPELAPPLQPQPKLERGFEFDATGLRAFSPDFELGPPEQYAQQDSATGVESSWELAYPPLSAFDPVSAYPRALHSGYSATYQIRVPHHLPRRVAGPSRTIPVSIPCSIRPRYFFYVIVPLERSLDTQVIGISR